MSDGAVRPPGSEIRMLRVLCPHHKRYRCAQRRSPSGKRWFACQTIYKSQFGGVALTRRAATQRGTSGVEEPRSGLTPRRGRSPRLRITPNLWVSRTEPSSGLAPGQLVQVICQRVIGSGRDVRSGETSRVWAELQLLDFGPRTVGAPSVPVLTAADPADHLLPGVVSPISGTNPFDVLVPCAPRTRPLHTHIGDFCHTALPSRFSGCPRTPVLAHRLRGVQQVDVRVETSTVAGNHSRW